jgi:hypothetical protein
LAPFHALGAAFTAFGKCFAACIMGPINGDRAWSCTFDG